MLAAGDYHTVLLKSDGTAVACGSNGDGQCDIPALVAGATYTQVAAGYSHTVLLKSDGTAVACGSNARGQCDIPALVAGATYTQVAAGRAHTVLLKSDGTAVACGDNAKGQCDVHQFFWLPPAPLQLTFGDDGIARLFNLNGDEVCHTAVFQGDLLSAVHQRLLEEGGLLMHRVSIVLPSGEFLLAALEGNPARSFLSAVGPERH